jgi:hypothetical protein
MLHDEDGPVHAQITLATMPSASMYMQLNFVAIKIRQISSHDFI